MRTLRLGLVGVSCIVIAACSDAGTEPGDPARTGTGAPDGAPDSQEPQQPQPDGASFDASPDSASPRDGGARDASRDGPKPTDASVPAPSGVLDVSCDATPPTASPNGEVIAYNDCQNQLVLRNVVTGAVARLPQLSSERIAHPVGLVFSDGYTTRIADWNGVIQSTFTSVGELARTTVTGSTWWAARRTREAVDGGFDMLFAITNSSTSTVFESARSRAMDSGDLDSIVSADGTRAAAIERPFGGEARLTFAATTAGAAVTTVLLSGLDYPRWIPGGTYQTRALFIASRKLFEADLVSGAIRPLSSGPVISASGGSLASPFAPVGFANVVVRDPLVYWAEPSGASYAVRRWDRQNPSSAPSVVASVVTANGSPLPCIDGSPCRGLALSPDGSHLLVLAREVGNQANWKSIDLASGVGTVLEASVASPSFGGAARVSLGDPPVFRDLGTGDRLALPTISARQLGLVSRDGTLLVARESSSFVDGGRFATVDFDRVDFSGSTTTVLALAASAENGMIASIDYVPVAQGVVLRVRDSIGAPPSLRPKYVLHIAR